MKSQSAKEDDYVTALGSPAQHCVVADVSLLKAQPSREI